MADSYTQAAQQAPKPSPALKALDVMVGVWEWPGEGYEASMTRVK